VPVRKAVDDGSKLNDYQKALIKDQVCMSTLRFIRDNESYGAAINFMPLKIKNIELDEAKIKIDESLEELESAGLLKVKKLATGIVDYLLTPQGKRLAILLDVINTLKELAEYHNYELKKHAEMLKILKNARKLSPLEISDITGIPIHDSHNEVYANGSLLSLLKDLERFGFVKISGEGTVPASVGITEKGKEAATILARVGFSGLLDKSKRGILGISKISEASLELLLAIYKYSVSFYQTLYVPFDSGTLEGENRLDGVLERLVNAKFIETKQNGFLIEVKITEEGRAALAYLDTIKKDFADRLRG